MVLETIQVLKFQRLQLTLGMVARYLLRIPQFPFVFLVKAVEHHVGSEIPERPLLVGLGFVPNTARALRLLHQKRKWLWLRCLLLHLSLDCYPPLNAFSFRSLPFVAQSDHKLSRLDAKLHKFRGGLGLLADCRGSQRVEHVRVYMSKHPDQAVLGRLAQDLVLEVEFDFFVDIYAI